MPVSVPGFPGLVPEYFALFSLIPRDFLDLITTNLPLSRANPKPKSQIPNKFQTHNFQ
jgi:hypothetical protein